MKRKPMMLFDEHMIIVYRDIRIDTAVCIMVYVVTYIYIYIYIYIYVHAYIYIYIYIYIHIHTYIYSIAPLDGGRHEEVRDGLQLRGAVRAARALQGLRGRGARSLS